MKNQIAKSQSTIKVMQPTIKPEFIQKAPWLFVGDKLHTHVQERLNDIAQLKKEARSKFLLSSMCDAIAFGPQGGITGSRWTQSERETIKRLFSLLIDLNNIIADDGSFSTDNQDTLDSLCRILADEMSYIRYGQNCPGNDSAASLARDVFEIRLYYRFFSPNRDREEYDVLSIGEALKEFEMAHVQIELLCTLFFLEDDWEEKSEIKPAA